jgi:hypothetical protein
LTTPIFFSKEQQVLFAQMGLEYLGHTISMDGVATEHSKTSSML